MTFLQFLKTGFIIAAVSLLFSRNSFADHKDIRVVTEVLPPLQYLNDENQFEGFAYDIIKAILDNSKLKFHLDVFPWARSYKLAKNNANACIYSMARTSEREGNFHWLLPLIQTRSVIFSLRSKNIQLKTIEDAKQYTIAVIREDVTHTLLLKLGFTEHENLYVVESADALLKLLYSQPEIDLIITDDVTMKPRAELAGVPFDAFDRLIELPNSELRFYFACNRNFPSEKLDAIKQSITQLSRKGVINKIYKDWQLILPGQN